MSEHDPRDDYDDEPWRGRISPDQRVKTVSDFIWCLGLFQMATSLFAMLAPIGGLIDRIQSDDPIRPEQFRAGSIVFILSIAGIGIAAVIMYGATWMKRFCNYRWVSAAIALTILSLPCFLTMPYGIPLGIWALVVVRRPDVRARFEANQRSRA
jgi:hypothetical protein